MNRTENERASHPARDAGERASQENDARASRNVVPFTRAVIPFPRKNYSYMPAAAPEEDVVGASHDDDPGPSAA